MNFSRFPSGFRTSRSHIFVIISGERISISPFLYGGCWLGKLERMVENTKMYTDTEHKNRKHYGKPQLPPLFVHSNIVENMKRS